MKLHGYGRGSKNCLGLLYWSQVGDYILADLVLGCSRPLTCYPCTDINPPPFWLVTPPPWMLTSPPLTCHSGHCTAMAAAKYLGLCGQISSLKMFCQVYMYQNQRRLNHLTRIFFWLLCKTHTRELFRVALRIGNDFDRLGRCEYWRPWFADKIGVRTSSSG